MHLATYRVVSIHSLSVGLDLPGEPGWELWYADLVLKLLGTLQDERVV